MRGTDTPGDIVLWTYGLVVAFPCLLVIIFWLGRVGNGRLVDKYEQDGNLKGLQQINKEADSLLRWIIPLLILGIILLYMIDGGK